MDNYSTWTTVSRLPRCSQHVAGYKTLSSAKQRPVSCKVAPQLLLSGCHQSPNILVYVATLRPIPF